MVDINTFLLMMIYMLSIVLLVFLIILVIKVTTTVNRFNGMLDEVNNKITKIDKALRIVDVLTDNMALISDKIVDVISDLIRKIFNKRSNRKEEEINE